MSTAPVTPGKLLQRQLQRLWGVDSPEALADVMQALTRLGADDTTPPRLQTPLTRLPQLLGRINDTYEQLERDLALSRRSLDISSQELMQANQTLREETRQALKDSEERLALAVQGSNIGLWDWDLVSDHVHFSQEWAAILGYSVSDLAPHSSTLVHLLHPDDGKRFGLAMSEYFSQAQADMYRDDVRLRCKDGSYKWIEFKGRIVQCAPDGQPMRATGVSLDISARKSWEQAMAEARDAAQAANRSKSDFLANMSHEIRTPMNGILGLTELCLSTRLDDEQRGYLEMAQASAKSLLTVLNDILDFSKIEANKLDIEHLVFHLPQVLRHSLAPLKPRADSLELALVTEVAPDVPEWLTGDPGRLRQVLVNLVGNAVKFTEAGQVRVTVSRVATAPQQVIRFTVSDTGIGIAPARLATVFDAFSQADTSITRRFGGTGLGLTISARLIRLMGGELKVSSQLGQGSTFWFELPLPSAQAPSADTSPLTTEVPTGLHVLVAEDHPINQVVARKVLEFLGQHVTLVETGTQAVQACTTQVFDMVFMDIQMPEMDGFAATRHIRALELPLQRHTPIIAMTAHAMEGYRERCLAGGMDGYVTKPVDRKQLLQEMRRVLHLAH
jgi:PAS domain S-box-containing protein